MRAQIEELLEGEIYWRRWDWKKSKRNTHVERDDSSSSKLLTRLNFNCGFYLLRWLSKVTRGKVTDAGGDVFILMGLKKLLTTNAPIAGWLSYFLYIREHTGLNPGQGTTS